ncbi:MAG: hypothetical protein WKF75_14130, partial [Singulisphaera sp.]
DGLERAERAVRGLEDRWRRGEPDLEKYWAESDCDKTVSVLAALVKVDLRSRYERGERPTVRDYFERFPDLCEHGDRVISLVYEEFCLREEQGEHPDPEQFCDDYDPWRDSLALQLHYHREFSQVVGPVATAQFPRRVIASSNSSSSRSWAEEAARVSSGLSTIRWADARSC